MQTKFKNKSRLSRLFSIILIIFILTVLFTVYANVSVLSFSERYIIEAADTIKLATNFETVIVLGAGVYEDGTPCPMLKDRLDTGLLLFEEKKVDTILLTGDHGRVQYDEVNGMKAYVFNKDIDKKDVFLDHAGFSTYESMYRAKAIFTVQSALVVTQSFHLNRAVYIARKLGIDAYGISADLTAYPKDEWIYLEIREYFARVKDYIYINILRPPPTFLGDQIPITGSSEATYDYLEQ